MPDTVTRPREGSTPAPTRAELQVLGAEYERAALDLSNDFLKTGDARLLSRRVKDVASGVPQNRWRNSYGATSFSS
jgi:hypothetical protein